MDTYESDFRALFTAEYAHVCRTVFLIVGDWQSAEDVAQEAFARGFAKRKLLSYDRPGAWVRRVAIHLSLSMLRRMRLSGRHVPTWSLATATDGGVMIATERVDLFNAMGELSAQQRAAVALHYFDDLAISDVAIAMDCSEGTVKSHLHRGRERLAAALADEEEDHAIAR